MARLYAPPAGMTSISEGPARRASRRPFVPDVLTGILPKVPRSRRGRVSRASSSRRGTMVDANSSANGSRVLYSFLRLASALSRFSFALNFTILLINPKGIGFSNGNLTEPLAPS